MRSSGSQPAQDNHLDHLEKALTRTVAQAAALIEQSKREVKRSHDLLDHEPRKVGRGPVLVLAGTQ